MSVGAYHGAGEAMHAGIVTETWPPEINGVAHTVHHMTRGLLARRHTVHVVRPRQHAEDRADDSVLRAP